MLILLQARKCAFGESQAEGREGRRTMSFLNSLQQVVAGVTSSVTSLSLSPKRFPFGRENSTGGSDVTTTTAPQHQSHHHRPGGSPNPRLGPKLVPTPGAAGGASPRPQGRCKSFMNHMMHPPPMMQQPKPKKERERRPLPVLQCGDRYTFWPEYDPSQTW